MIFILVSLGDDDIRVFSSYSLVEQVMKIGIQEALALGREPNWCYTMGYSGIDELVPIYTYYISPNGDIVREAL